MANIFILADQTAQIRLISSGISLRNEETKIHYANISHFDPAMELAPGICDIVLLDHGNPVDRRIALIEAIRQVNPATKILITSVPCGDAAKRTDLIFSYLENGAAGYVGEHALDELPSALEEMLRGGAWIEPSLVAELVERTVALREALRMIGPHTYGTGRPKVLTRRQNEVLELLATGLSNRQIAEDLYISTGTVKNHVHRILDVLQASSRQQAVEFYQYFNPPIDAA